MLARPRDGFWPRPLSVLAWRAGVHGAVFAVAFALSGRAVHAGVVAIIATGVVVAASAIKRAILSEALVATDFALVAQAIKHPKLYYINARTMGIGAVIFALLALVTWGWFLLEPPVYDTAWPRLVAGLSAIAFLGLALTPTVGRRAEALFDRGSSKLLPPDAPVAPMGVVSALTLSALARRVMDRPSAAARRAIQQRAAVERTPDAPQTVICVQLESFIDLRVRAEGGGPALPGLDALKNEAIAHGGLIVPGDGAYTMRAEFGFLTGLSEEVLGLDRTDPYLVAPAYANAAIAGAMKNAGYSTVFMHPYDIRFFGRDRAIPALGFDEVIDISAFPDAPHVGPYIADTALADAIIAGVRKSDKPLFLHAVTIENHGPWGRGRLPFTDNPLEQYIHHLQHTDALISMLHQALAGLPGGALLCVYGDHVPARTLPLTLHDRFVTEYVLWDSRSRAGGVFPSTIRVCDLGLTVLDRLSPKSRKNP